MQRVRPRYIAVTSTAPARQLERSCLGALRAALGRGEPERARVRVFHVAPGKAVVRVDHRTLAAARAALEALARDGARARLVTTSGTLRQAKRALGVRSGPRRRRARARDGAARAAPNVSTSASTRSPETVK